MEKAGRGQEPDRDVSRTIVGLDNLLANPDRYVKGKTVGLVVNHTSLAGDFRHSIAHFRDHPKFILKKLFAPEHGLYGVDQDMAAVSDSRDPVSGLEISSLYGSEAKSLSPDPRLLDGLDALIFDIQDIGSRYYTFVYTMANCMRVCREAGVPIVVCDRPNPIGGARVEGNLVGDAWRSFVGQYPLPNRHGMTAGELALLFNGHFGIGCELVVAPMLGWNRSAWFDETGVPWLAPSPNMPTLATATVYPGMCFVEGTQLSEGRGSCLPFEQCGAPYIDAHKLARALAAENLPGVHFRPHYFKPTFHKWAGKTCGGVQLHVTGRDRFKPVISAVAVLRAVAKLYPGDFRWRTEPYEFVSDRPAIDLLYGNPKLRERIVPGEMPLREVEDSWEEELSAFAEVRRQYLLY